MYRKLRTSHRYPAHTVYPYLLSDLTFTRSNHVWVADITHIPMTHGFMYLFAVLDWASRRVLAWHLSNTLTTDFCLRVVQGRSPGMGPRTSSMLTKGASFLERYLTFYNLTRPHRALDGRTSNGVYVDNLPSRLTAA